MTRHDSLRWARAACLLAPFACSPTDPPIPDDSQPYDVTRYALRGEFDWERGRLLATVAITFKTDDPPQTSIVLDSLVEVTAVRAADGAALEFHADPEAQTLQVDIASLAGQDKLQIEVTYEAATSESLRAWDVRAGDPATTRAVYSFSEPQDAPRWMPVQNRPDDRAEFSVEMRMRSDEALIGNGTLELDEKDGEARRMRWATDYTLPPYLMAFAVGPFATTQGTHGDVPIGTWHRPDLDGDFDLVVSELDRMISIYEPMLGPYPFEKYQLILLPAVGGGIEHAGITFQSETSSNQPAIASDLQLTAHELAHQWWGDLVTVATWDDVWIKEGFASLLSTEALRRAEDQSDAGTLMGDLQSAASGDAIRDAALPPPEKYTSGPYGRAAWLLTQIRSVVGDDDFFAIVQDLLDEHAFGTIGTNDMILAFAERLGNERSARMRSAIDAPDLPSLTIEPSPGGATVTLHDPDQILVAPIELEWRRASGDVEPHTLTAGEPLTLAKQDPGDHLVIDPRDVHLRLAYMIPDDDSYSSYYDDLVPLVLPEGPDAVAAFSALPGIHQRFALTYAGLPPISADQLPDLIAGLHSDAARAIVLRAACNFVAVLEDPALQDPWLPALTAAFTDDPPLAGVGSVPGYSECAPFLDVAAMFADDWTALSAGLESPTIPYPRVLFLSRFELPPDDAQGVWEPVVRRGHSLRVRGVAAGRLYSTIADLDPEDSEAVAPWRALVLDLLATNEASEVVSSMLYSAGALALDDYEANAEFIDAFVDILHNPVTWPLHARTLCAAIPLVVDEAGWERFVARLTDAPLSQDALDILADPTQCQ